MKLQIVQHIIDKMFSGNEIDEYGLYMDWVREQIADEDDRRDPRFSYELIDIDEVMLERDDLGRYYRHHWSMTYSDGEVVVGELKTATFEDWMAVKVAEQRADRLDELGIK